MRGRKGFAKLSSAITFGIWYGKRKIVSQTKFTKRQRTVAQKRKYLENLVIRIEREKNRLLKQRRLLAAQKKKIIRQEKRKLEELPPEKVKFVKPDAQEAKFDSEEIKAKSTLLIFEEAYAEASPEFKNVEIIDTTIIPLKPKENSYNRRVVEKIVHTTSGRELFFSILDFDLVQKRYITVNVDNFDEAFEETFSLLFPHADDFRKETYKSSEAFIFRFKFTWNPQDSDKSVAMGISLRRTDIRTRKYMIEIFRDTFMKFFGTIDDRTKEILTKNYLADNSTLYITGMTVEAYNEHKPQNKHGSRSKRSS